MPQVAVGTSIVVLTPDLETTALSLQPFFLPDHTTNYWPARQQPKEHIMADKDKHDDAEDFAAINTPG